MSIDEMAPKTGKVTTDQRPVVNAKKLTGNEIGTLPTFQYIVLREWQEPNGLRYKHIRFRQCLPSQADQERAEL